MSKNDNQGPAPKKTLIGGQAVLEGLMMMGPQKTALAVRQMDGTIKLEYMPSGLAASKAASIPFVRGSVRLFRQMVIGVKALLRSADLLEEGEALAGKEVDADPVEASTVEVSEAATVPEEKKAKEPTNLTIYLSAAIGILVGIGL